ncbi:MAG TPA: glycoside hydrolase family 15 protein [Gemmatimonadales bacterium]|nr:glycoside hydrolase family 15 protein [Gemmatimonadales bacterium]
MSSLDLGLVGNGTLAAFIDPRGEVVWACVPRFDGDPTFCRLLQHPPREADHGRFAIELLDLDRAEQHYLTNTPILVTRLTDRHGGVVEITDHAPRFRQHGRVFCPTMLVRQVRRVTGAPRIRIVLRPAFHYGGAPAERTSGSHHIRYVGPEAVLRLTTDASITAILEERPTLLSDPITLLLGPDETVPEAVAETGRRFAEATAAYWREWVRYLSIPFEWQEEVIRAAITLKLNACEDTGAIVAALTTSIPEAANTPRTWDYRFCWLRDAYFVVDALNRLGATRTMERYVAYITDLVAAAEDGVLRPVYGISGWAVPEERTVPTLPGYRGMGPVRVGNQAYDQVQNDVYGAAILAATHTFFDRRLVRRGDEALFRRLEVLGHRAAERYDRPDAGPWELRGRARVHTFSSVMCWAGCDRLARIARELGLDDREAHWRAAADRIHAYVCANAWDAARNTFTGAVGAPALDASLLLLHELGFLAADDPRFAGTVAAIERELRRGDYIYRYVDADDFGHPESAFLVCTFWYINALAALGRTTEARAWFERVLALRNRHGLLAEDVDPATGEQWGNFVQTYSMVGLVRAAIRLSIPWDRAF